MAVATKPHMETEFSIPKIIETEKTTIPVRTTSQPAMETEPPKVSLDTSVNTQDSSSVKFIFDPTNSFEGDLDTDNKIPTQKILKLCDEISVFDAAHKARPFRSLYTGPNVARRVLVIFIRHFFCGVCTFTDSPFFYI